jgi:hypothetical protein
MRLSVTLLLVAAAAAARGADAPAADSIAQARKDIATIKAPAPQQDPAAVQPPPDTRDLGPVQEAPRQDTRSLLDPDLSLDPAKKKQGTGNWLVDAMDKNSDHSQSPKGRDDLLRDGESPDSRIEAALQDGREKPASKEATGPAYNPLDAFMGGWISARDHELLLPAGKGDGLAAGDPGKGRADMLPGLDLAQAQAAEIALPAPDAAGPVDGKASNPYLSVMDSLAPASTLKIFVAPDVSGFVPAAPVGGQRGAAPAGVELGPLDIGHSFLPDFAQPSDDDTYFKQMKRF